jgi:hypothetical protein
MAVFRGLENKDGVQLTFPENVFPLKSARSKHRPDWIEYERLRVHGLVAVMVYILVVLIIMILAVALVPMPVHFVFPFSVAIGTGAYGAAKLLKRPDEPVEGTQDSPG